VLGVHPGKGCPPGYGLASKRVLQIGLSLLRPSPPCAGTLWLGCRPAGAKTGPIAGLPRQPKAGCGAAARLRIGASQRRRRAFLQPALNRRASAQR